MRTRLATRPARLVLAAAAAVALTATMTACEDDSATPAAPSTGGSDGGSDSDDATDEDTTDEDAPGSGHEGEPVTQGCGTTDLTFTVTEETQAGGYFLVAAQANEGISCTLEGSYPMAFFGSGEESHVSPAGQSVDDSIEMSGDTIAYAGINPKTTNDDNGAEYEQVFISILGEDGANAVEFPISATLVDQPEATNWSLRDIDAVPMS
ncbi:hypothetical protein ACFVUW_22760 [Streptomyces xiamenensis]|uniref:hypothetical protein n=1 Tax=Streptomyces xiamenensis TaxID=408015 RepID=UPI0036E7151B